MPATLFQGEVYSSNVGQYHNYFLDYVAAVNLTGDGSVTFTYDGRGRLTQTSNGYHCLVNGLGRRVAKSGLGVAGGLTYFVYDEQGHLIGEYDAGGAVRQELIYVGNTPAANMRTAAGGGVDIYPARANALRMDREMGTGAEANGVGACPVAVRAPRRPKMALTVLHAARPMLRLWRIKKISRRQAGWRAQVIAA